MQLKDNLLKVFGAFALGLVSIPVVYAENIRMDEVSSGSLLVKTERSGQYKDLPMQSTDVEIRVTGPIARTQMRQTFYNPGDEWLEALYVFPLPEQAAVDHMDLVVGERIIQGQIQEKQQARNTYEKARQEGKNTALLEQFRPNLFTTSVANIPPKSQVEVRLEYQQQLVWRDQQFALRFPMAITPRYTPADQLPATTRVEVHQQVSNGWAVLPGEIANVIRMTEVESGELPVSDIGNTRLSVLLNTGFPVKPPQSRYHGISTAEKDNGELEITLVDGAVRPDRDFELTWKPDVQQQPAAAFFTEAAGDNEQEQYGLLMVMPPQLQDAVEPNDREILFIIDTSGSMGGASIRQAREALLMAINRLKPADTFNVIAFSSSTNVLFDSPQTANAVNVNYARGFVSDLQAGGGTEMMPALKAAMRMKTDQNHRLKQVVFITDGAVGNEHQLLSYIHAELNNRRLFTVGIGSAPNSYFMKEAAHFGRGTYSFIGSPNEVSEKMQQLFTRLESPVLTHLALKANAEVELLPENLPDLYAGEPLNVTLKLKSGSKPLTEVTLTGRMGATQWQQQLTLDKGQQQSGLAVHWARMKIRQWMRAGIRGIEHDQIKHAVTDLALKHHLVSQYTSLVAVDVTPVRPVNESLNQKALDAVMPANYATPTQQGVMLASGATSSQAYLLAGLILLLVSIGLMKLTAIHDREGSASS